jgi:hypothetical protein
MSTSSERRCARLNGFAQRARERNHPSDVLRGRCVVKFIIDVTLDANAERPETPSDAADELQDAISRAELPAWVFSVDSVDAAVPVGAERLFDVSQLLASDPWPADAS